MTPELRNLLKQVSRSFYLTLRILPRSINSQLSITYLLARTTDTITDTNLLPADQRLTTLQEVRKAINAAADGSAFNLKDISIKEQGTSIDGALLVNLEKILRILQEFSSGDRSSIRNVLNTISHGQEMDMVRFGTASADTVVALSNDQELNDYTYCVAGCVGEFWTKMCRSHVFPKARLNDELLLQNGVRFGRGLQLVNILRDLPEDLHRGRCYIPKDRLASCGLQPRDLLDPAAINRFRLLYDSYLQQAEEHLSAGWSYTEMLPYRQMRIRLACAWPILIGIKTLHQLRTNNVLDSHNRIKLNRAEIHRLMIQTVLLCPYPTVFNRLFERAKRA
jgi:farnesyl-diphosphate farnesyltransferase